MRHSISNMLTACLKVEKTLLWFIFLLNSFTEHFILTLQIFLQASAAALQFLRKASFGFRLKGSCSHKCKNSDVNMNIQFSKLPSMLKNKNTTTAKYPYHSMYWMIPNVHTRVRLSHIKELWKCNKLQVGK